MKADPELCRLLEQYLRLRARHFGLEKRIDLRLILHEPARKERRQSEFRIDDEIAAAALRLSHQNKQALDDLRAGVAVHGRPAQLDPALFPALRGVEQSAHALAERQAAVVKAGCLPRAVHQPEALLMAGIEDQA
ncbi:MAG TPA: hypothetical protein PKM58_02720 [Pyrinomonadaceae bacterium]|nr:hypothetical protein [Pyrinomonadaceae bacterium]